MKKVFKVLRISVFILFSLFLVMIIGLFIYTRDSYQPLDEMYEEIEALNTDHIQRVNDFDQISFFVDQPKKNIIIIPGGKVNPESYSYLAIMLALEGYDVTIVKTVFNLAILTPNYGARFLREDIENVVIGHSLGGTVASMFSSGLDEVTDIIFLAGYPIADVSDKRVLIITAQFDLVLDQRDLDDSEELLPNDAVIYEISGGNHGQFGWYGIQKGDGTSTILTIEQQHIVIEQIIGFIE